MSLDDDVVAVGTPTDCTMAATIEGIISYDLRNLHGETTGNPFRIPCGSSSSIVPDVYSTDYPLKVSYPKSPYIYNQYSAVFDFSQFKASPDPRYVLLEALGLGQISTGDRLGFFKSYFSPTTGWNRSGSPRLFMHPDKFKTLFIWYEIDAPPNYATDHLTDILGGSVVQSGYYPDPIFLDIFGTLRSLPTGFSGPSIFGYFESDSFYQIATYEGVWSSNRPLSGSWLNVPFDDTTFDLPLNNIPAPAINPLTSYVQPLCYPNSETVSPAWLYNNIESAAVDVSDRTGFSFITMDGITPSTPPVPGSAPYTQHYNDFDVISCGTLRAKYSTYLNQPADETPGWFTRPHSSLGSYNPPIWDFVGGLRYCGYTAGYTTPNVGVPRTKRYFALFQKNEMYATPVVLFQDYLVKGSGSLVHTCADVGRDRIQCVAQNGQILVVWVQRYPSWGGGPNPGDGLKTMLFKAANVYDWLPDSDKATSLTRSGSTATCVTTNPHPYWLDGDLISVLGATPSGYNVTDEPITRIDDYTFDFAVSGALATPATGDIYATVKESLVKVVEYPPVYPLGSDPSYQSWVDWSRFCLYLHHSGKVYLEYEKKTYDGTNSTTLGTSPALMQ